MGAMVAVLSRVDFGVRYLVVVVQLINIKVRVIYVLCLTIGENLVLSYEVSYPV